MNEFFTKLIGHDLGRCLAKYRPSVNGRIYSWTHWIVLKHLLQCQAAKGPQSSKNHHILTTMNSKGFEHRVCSHHGTPRNPQLCVFWCTLAFLLSSTQIFNLFIYIFAPSTHELWLFFPTLVIKCVMKSNHAMSGTGPLVRTGSHLFPSNFSFSPH